MFLTFSDARVSQLPTQQALTRGRCTLHAGDADKGADLKVIRYGAQAKPEHALTAPHAFPEQLFTRNSNQVSLEFFGRIGSMVVSSGL